MKTDILILKEYGWAITIIHDTDCSDVEEVVYYLQSIDCPKQTIKEAKLNILLCKLNTGLTYSNFKLRRTIMLISNTSSSKETLNTVTHECYHFILHLLKTMYLTEERAAILIGNLVAEIIDTIK